MGNYKNFFYKQEDSFPCWREGLIFFYFVFFLTLSTESEQLLDLSLSNLAIIQRKNTFSSCVSSNTLDYDLFVVKRSLLQFSFSHAE